jgi:hypothetical protein
VQAEFIHNKRGRLAPFTPHQPCRGPHPKVSKNERRDLHPPTPFVPRQNADQAETLPKVMAFGAKAASDQIELSGHHIHCEPSGAISISGRPEDCVAAHETTGGEWPNLIRSRFNKPSPVIPTLPPACGRSRQHVVRDNRVGCGRNGAILFSSFNSIVSGGRLLHRSPISPHLNNDTPAVDLAGRAPGNPDRYGALTGHPDDACPCERESRAMTSTANVGV